MNDTATARWERYNDAGRRSFGQGQFAEAEEAFRAAVLEAEQLGPASAQLAASLNALGQLRLQAKDLAGAEAHLTRALAIREQVYGPNHQALVSSLNNLGALYDAKGSLDQAESSLLRALAISEQQLGGEHPEVALAMSNLAKLHFKRREFSKADKLLLRLLAIKRGLGKDHPEVATVLGSLARLRQAVGKHDLAEQLWRQALVIRERAFAPNDPIVATTLESLADCIAPQRGRIADAIALRERALEIRIMAQGPTHPTVANAHAKLAELQGRLDPQVPAAEPPPSRSSRELPAPIESNEVPRFERDESTTSAEVNLPWLQVDNDPLPLPRISQPVTGSSLEPVRPTPAPPPLRPTPIPFASKPPAPMRKTPIRSDLNPMPAFPPPPQRTSGPAGPSRPARPTPMASAPMRATGPRPTVRPPARRRSRGGGFFRKLFTTVVVLGALGGGAWFATSRGYVKVPPPVQQVLDRASATVRPVLARLVPPSKRPSAAPHDSVSRAIAEGARRPASARVTAAASPAAAAPATEDELQPNVKVDLPRSTAGAVQLDAITRAIDRTTKAKLDSVEKARLEPRSPPTVRP
ncbi:MAG TPA: tetratricopeptide repeat protein [Gemmatimonadaceae bacterium]|nr:tetratricopeptide repeat protein [Gemmatimonadaceae bacterium]